MENDNALAKVFWRTGLLIVTLSLLSCCAAGTLTFSVPGKPISVSAGQRFAIVLESNKTTGYEWNAKLNGIKIGAIAPADVVKSPPPICAFVTAEYAVPSTNAQLNSRQLSGAGGWEIWTFDAISRGKMKISFKYSRAWEKDVPPVKTADFEVFVE
jgi:inhibitor of cysteine peptidase